MGYEKKKKKLVMELGDHKYNTWYLRPILTQLSLQSVEQVHFSTFAWGFAPKTLEIVLPRRRMSRSFLEKVPLSTFSSELLPQKMFEKNLVFPRLGTSLSFLVWTYRKLFFQRTAKISNCIRIGPTTNETKLQWWWILGRYPVKKCTLNPIMA